MSFVDADPPVVRYAHAWRSPGGASGRPDVHAARGGPEDPGRAGGVFAAFGPKTRTRTSWGSISAWAWGASRVLDWIETVPELDARHVAVIASDAPSTQEFCKCKALWDTGAVFSVISRRLAAQLGLMPIDKGFAYTVQGTYEPSVYLLDVMLPNGMVVKNLHVSDGDFDDCDVLIGMDIIKLGDLQITLKS